MKTIVTVRFRSGCKSYYFDPGELTIQAGQDVIVETSQGVEYATCVEGNREIEESQLAQPLCPVLRIATENDRRTALHIGEREKEAALVCQRKIAQHGLEMKLVDVSCNFDGNKIIFFFTSDGRVDFRELVKDLASVFRARIELRQIGVRDEAKMLGGLGICGRPFCCSSFLEGFMPVSIKMAKTQNLSLNPTKISGTCGRLMCCLKYEQDAYEDAVKRMPKNDSFVLTPDGPGNVVSVDLLRETVKVALDGVTGAPKLYQNCELNVLRNGKGSREGIEIPATRPLRYVKEEEIPSAESFLYSAMMADTPAAAAAETPAAEEREGERRSRRRRGRGRGGKGGDASGREAVAPQQEKVPAAEKNAEKNGERPPRARGERGGKPQNDRPAKSQGDKAAKPQGERPARPRPERQSKPQSEGAPAPESAAAAAAADEGGEKKARRRRPHHRGGRRRHGGGEGGAAPAAE